MPEITLQNIKELLQTEFQKELGPIKSALEGVKEIVRTELKKELGPIKEQLSYLTLKADKTSIILSNLSVDMKDVPDNTEEILNRTRNAENNVDWLVKERKDEESAGKINLYNIGNHKAAILMVAEKTGIYNEVKKRLEE